MGAFLGDAERFLHEEHESVAVPTVRVEVLRGQVLDEVRARELLDRVAFEGPGPARAEVVGAEARRVDAIDAEEPFPRGRAAAEVELHGEASDAACGLRLAERFGSSRGTPTAHLSR